MRTLERQARPGAGAGPRQRALGHLRARLTARLAALAAAEALPARWADDPALRAARREARLALARLIAALERLERPGGAARAGPR
jgi:hypothetical protein